jgi:recombination protein RecT
MTTNTTNSVSNAVATQENTGPGALVEAYRADLAQVMPSHVKPDMWVRLAVGALRRDPKLAAAAANNTGALMGALMYAARLGLEPGTEQFYLRPIKRKGQFEVQGIPGYQGIIELIYRAGAVSSVIVEVVRQQDIFRYVPGRDERPVHEIDWDAEDRGPLKLAYAYAIMKDGATSKVVVLNKHHIARAKDASDGVDSEYSPWRNDEEAMWLKTAARRLSKWVPTSAEYMREQMRAAAEVAREQTTGVAPPPVSPAAAPSPAPAPPPHAFVHDGDGGDQCALDDCGRYADDDIHGGRA